MSGKTRQIQIVQKAAHGKNTLTLQTVTVHFSKLVNWATRSFYSV